MFNWLKIQKDCNWSWKGADGRSKHEIDLIIIDKARFVKDANVGNKTRIGSLQG